ncbi:MAG: hypothetical protein K2O67_03320 [Clostridia bacterium]|nr:hypothetical protein [Clostridia bacterium]
MKTVKTKASKRLIRAIIAFAASIVLCVGVCLAWFLKVEEVDSSGMKPTFKGINIKEFNVTAYSLLNNNGVLTVDEKLTGDTIEMQPYGGLTAYNATQALLLEISYVFKQNTGKTYKIFTDCDLTPQQVDRDEDAEDGFICHLSDAVKYDRATLAGEAVSGAVVTLTEDEQLSYLYQTTNDENETVYAKQQLTLNDFEITDEDVEGGKFYIVIDYDPLYVAELYSAVLNADGTLNSAIVFNGDMSFYMKETDSI